MVNDRLAAVRKRLDAEHARVAAELAARSRPELGNAGLARAAGHRSAAKLIAAATGGHTGDAARLIEVGRATAPRQALTGEILPALHPHVADAFESGALSVAAAATITRTLDKLPPRVSTGTRLSAEETLVSHARDLALDEVHAVLQRVVALLDPDGLEPRIDDLRGQRSLKIFSDAAGMTVINGRLDPETAAPIVAAIDRIVTHQLRVSRGRNVSGANGDAVASDDGSANALGVETRSIAQMNADALSAIATHIGGCAGDTVPAAATTVVVRMGLDDLLGDSHGGGAGIATIDGIEQPIDAGTARRLAAKADLIPLVLGTESEVLDLGRRARAFSAAQRLVLAERDGGCAGCHLPASFTEAHHLTLWSKGGCTDLDEGVLLCTACHHRVHDEGWEIRIERPPGAPAHAGIVWFIPPPHVDPARTPRLGGRRRFDPLTWGLTA